MDKLLPNGAGAEFCAESNPENSRKQQPFTRVLDSRNRPLRGLWRRKDRFYARLYLEDSTGHKRDRRILLAALTLGEARKELDALRVRRNKRILSVLSGSARIEDYIPKYLADAKTAKRPRVIENESLHLRHWTEALGNIRLDRINRGMIIRFRSSKITNGWSPRTANLAVTVLNNLLSHARDNGLMHSLPTDGLKPLRYKSPKRRLVAPEEINQLCDTIMGGPPRGRRLVDYLRLLQYSGARQGEALRLKWSDVDWERSQLTIGSDGLSKNHEARVLDCNTALENHLKSMHERRASSSAFLFPSLQETGADKPVGSFKCCLKRACKKAGVRICFHDLRHHFISYAVMAGVDFLTIAKWVGHKDGGILIGRVYGHLNNEHAKRQAQKLTFGSF